MDKYHAFELGLAMGKGILLNNQTDSESLATDGLEWITIKPHDDVNNRYLENFSVLLKW